MVRIQGEVPLPEAWTSELQLNGGTAVEWDAVISGPLPPGGYAVTFEYAGTDEDETPIEPAISAFEIRAPAEGERFEIMRRSACAHMLSGRYEQAAAGAARLLNPDLTKIWMETADFN